MPKSAVARCRLYRLSALLALAGLLATSCTNSVSGTGVPDGDDAAAYVSAKFSTTLKGLSDDLAADQPRKSKLRWYGKIDDKDADQTVLAVQLGSPPSRYVKNQSNQEPGMSRESLHPAGSKVKYVLLGPYYSSLAPTPWVSMPYTDWGLSPCAWDGYRMVCHMLNAVATAAEQTDVAKKATSFEDGSVELKAEITLRDFLKHQVINFPDPMLKKISAPMKEESIATMIRLKPDGELSNVSMNANISTGRHKVEIHINYEVLGKPTQDDLPQKPRDKKVTKLPDKAAVDDFHERMGELD